MTITRYIHPKKSYKKRLLEIYHKYSENDYYNDCPKKFSELIMLIEDFPSNCVEKLKKELQYVALKDWITNLFLLEESTVFQLTLENEIQFIINNITKLPFCKCKVKLRILENQT